ncbi:glutathione S-transferase family protein [Pseudomonas typographi]|uniref:glutathione S-transferase family protein n=1 Tax=Pseudomonas typographi TaxID=2715964 RepID=UPI0016891197|nr:glutathione S-transferase family protein [Pseudomonas typographi]MBD1588842.1 glutathione S-transferase family protein [Pseudomonas typographi]
MSDIILHHYDVSPFSQKVRRMLAFKELPWRGVTIANTLPKPLLVPLTGGYRRTPVLQIGADIYCDSRLITAKLDELQPSPALVPESSRGQIEILSDWSESRAFWWTLLPIFADLMPILPDEFVADRVSMLASLTREQVQADAPHAFDQFQFVLDNLERILSQQPFMVGTSFTSADAACSHTLLYTVHSPRVYAAVQQRPRVAAWLERVNAVGVERCEEMSAEEALDIACTANPVDIAPYLDDFIQDVSLGDAVVVQPDDYGCVPVTGTLARATRTELVILRESATLGRTAVHFPRLGFKMTRQP